MSCSSVVIGPLAALFLAVAPALTAPPPQPAAPALVTDPDWLTRPGSEDMARLYPKVASALTVEGLATIACRITVLGVLTDCTVAAEAPLGFGFGRAGLQMAPLFRMRPGTQNGRPVEGTVRIPIRMKLPPAPPLPPPPAAAHSGPRLALARRWLKERPVGVDLAQVYVQRALTLEFVTNDGSSDAVRSAATAALRTATAEHAPQVSEALAEAVAAMFSEAELRAIVAFAESSAGAVSQPPASISSELSAIWREHARMQQVGTRAAFCRTRDCEGRPDLLYIKAVDEGAGKVTILRPVWAASPNRNAIIRTMPSPLAFMGVNGQAALRCTVQAQGFLGACVVLGETPPGIGLGAAALSLAPSYKLHPTQMGQGAEGEQVLVVVPFAPVSPVRDSPLAPPGEASESALAAARSYIAATTDDGLRRYTLGPAAAQFRITAGRDGPIRDAALQAEIEDDLVAGAASAMAWREERLARAYAQTYTPAQLQAALRFHQSPAGRAMSARRADLGTAMSGVFRRYASLIDADAHASLCKAVDCASPPPAPAPLPRP